MCVKYHVNLSRACVAASCANASLFVRCLTLFSSVAASHRDSRCEHHLLFAANTNEEKPKRILELGFFFWRALLRCGIFDALFLYIFLIASRLISSAAAHGHTQKNDVTHDVIATAVTHRSKTFLSPPPPSSLTTLSNGPPSASSHGFRGNIKNELDF